MMKRAQHIGLLLLLPLLLATGCREDLLDQVPKLTVYLDIPRPALTRADVGLIPSEFAAENTINTLQIWVFLSESCGDFAAGTCIGYLSPNPLYMNDASNYRFAVPLNPLVADAHPNVDVFVLANAASAGYPDLGAQTQRVELNNLVMEGSFFGIYESAPVCTEVPEGGLPFAGVGKGMKMKGTYPVLTLDTVTLTRTVSKLRFVFSQLRDEEGPVNECQVTGIQINGSTISASEYLFNDSMASYKIAPNQYVVSPMIFQGLTGEQIALSTAPEDYAFRMGQTATEYESLVLQGIEDGVLSSQGLCYLRESDKQLTGRIDYVMNGTVGHADFTMKDPGDFARNHSWIVYMYFTRDAIRFTVTWTPWEEGNSFILTD